MPSHFLHKCSTSLLVFYILKYFCLQISHLVIWILLKKKGILCLNELKTLFCIFSFQVNGIRWHQCTYCTKEFKKPSDLVRHIRIHTHEKPYKCRQCFRAFAVKSTLTAHIKTHTGVKDFQCEVCNKMFSTQGSLKVHLRLHTGL